MVERVLDTGSLRFRAEARLLQELGLRLVTSPEVALVELIKNAYDADSPSCTVRLEDDDTTLLVTDRGHGMTLSDFSTKWMRIATTSKVGSETSLKYKRPLTGAKGIGRFAVRYLGDYLTLESVAYDKDRKTMTKLTATFDWPKLDKASDLSDVSVSYRLVRVPEDTQTGTTLRIGKLRKGATFVGSRELRNDVLRMVSPLDGLERSRFAASHDGDSEDPGFEVLLPGESEQQDVSLAKVVLDSYWARLTINLHGKTLEYRVTLSTSKQTKALKLPVTTSISKGFFADIRYFPRRKGMLSGKGLDGRKAWGWVREHHGIAVVDHGFRIKPYGFPNDDWLKLDRDTAHNAREWATKIAKEHFPITAAERADPSQNPMLNLPQNLQVVGAVFVESKRASSSKIDVDLIPAMDREGLLDNEGRDQLVEFVRAGIEFLAREDKTELQRLEIEKAKQATKTAREEIKKAIEHIEQSSTLVANDKARIITQYRRLADRVDEQEELTEQSRRHSLTMGLLGVVAGFMTHESKAAVHDLERAVGQVRALAKKNTELGAIADDLNERLENFRNYIEYSRVFVRNVRTSKEAPLSSAGQVRHILNVFKPFADDRGIEIANEIAKDVYSPPIPVTVYSGLLLNLYTNALKAVIAAKASVRHPRISFRAWNEKKRHIIEVADNGIGIPPELRKRIWDPLYTTTSDIGNPLGSGMGLGLTLVKQVAAEYGGSVSLVADPPPGFTTCFRIVLNNGSTR